MNAPKTVLATCGFDEREWRPVKPHENEERGQSLSKEDGRGQVDYCYEKKKKPKAKKLRDI